MPKLITSVKNWNWINRKEETSSERNKYRKHGITGSSGHSEKQATLSYRIKRNKACYMMLAPYFILFSSLPFTGCDECGLQFYLL